MKWEAEYRWWERMVQERWSAGWTMGRERARAVCREWRALAGVMHCLFATERGCVQCGWLWITTAAAWPGDWPRRQSGCCC